MELFSPGKVESVDFSGFMAVKNVDILRDDLIHPIVCGNKWRKLKYVVEYFLQNNFETMVTFGGAYSNHVVATAFAGKSFGFKTHAFIRGNEERELNHYEQLCMDNNMLLTHVPRDVYRDKKKLFDQYFSNNDKAFFLDEGGDHPLALNGCAEIIEGLENGYDYIILPIGTGTTMDGLLHGIENAGLPTRVIGISSLKNNFDLDIRMKKHDPDRWSISHDYHRGKYGKTDGKLLTFIKDFRSETGVPLETVYTGKMMMGFLDLIKKGHFKPDDRVLLLHTGGLLNM